MYLAAIGFENYKAFPRREEVEIRPLTILIGKNSAGKSAVARLPLLLARSLSDRAEGPFELEFDGLDFGGSFVDLIHDRIPHGALGVGARFVAEDGELVEFWAKVQHYAEYSLLMVSEFRLVRGTQAPVEMVWAGKDPVKDAEIYQIAGNRYRVLFRGLFPISCAPSGESGETPNFASGLSELFSRSRAQLTEALGGITYLGPFRDKPRRDYRFPGGYTKEVGIGGAKAPYLLGSDFLRRKGEVLDAVGRWFSKHLGGWKLDITRQGDSFSLILRSPHNPSLEVNITDVGTGIAQVLPIVVQRQFESITGAQQRIEIVEQPELHLHPGAHGDLADLYVDAVNSGAGRFIAETHSENFVLRVRRRVATGELDPAKVILYWINDVPEPAGQLRPIHIDRSGDIDFWPSRVFAEDFEEVRAIRSAQNQSDGGPQP